MSLATLKYINTKNLERFIEAQKVYYTVSATNFDAYFAAKKEYDLASNMLADDAASSYKAINQKEAIDENSED